MIALLHWNNLKIALALESLDFGRWEIQCPFFFCGVFVLALELGVGQQLVVDQPGEQHEREGLLSDHTASILAANLLAEHAFDLEKMNHSENKLLGADAVVVCARVVFEELGQLFLVLAAFGLETDFYICF